MAKKVIMSKMDDVHPPAHEDTKANVEFFFKGRHYNTALLTEEERAYLKQFPEQVRYDLG